MPLIFIYLDLHRWKSGRFRVKVALEDVLVFLHKSVDSLLHHFVSMDFGPWCSAGVWDVFLPWRGIFDFRIGEDLVR
jgi:hypothetical protein